MLSDHLVEYLDSIPSLNEVTKCELLRKWTLSEVYRITLQSGSTLILKWGGQEMAGEADIYRKLITPLQIHAPRIYHVVEQQQGSLMVMEDCGSYNLEQQPSANQFLQAASELARIRATASLNLNDIPTSVIRSYTVSASEFLSLLDKLLQSQHLAGNSTLKQLRIHLPDQLDKLYRTIPMTIVHHDYHAKNLVIQDNRVMPIDWSSSYLSPHLGDLYCLTTEASALIQVTREEIIAAYQHELGQHTSMEQLGWQVDIGGICWLIKTLAWLVDGGTSIIPGSEDWIPDLMKDMEQLSQNMNL